MDTRDRGTAPIVAAIGGWLVKFLTITTYDEPPISGAEMMIRAESSGVAAGEELGRHLLRFPGEIPKEVYFIILPRWRNPGYPSLVACLRRIGGEWFLTWESIDNEFRYVDYFVDYFVCEVPTAS